MTPNTWRSAAAVALLLTCTACLSSRGHGDETPASPQAQAQDRPLLIDHLVPRRDFTGPPPTRFEWTAIAGADEYALGVWSEADTMVWQQGRVRDTSVEFPKEIELEPGTYYWSVTAVRDGRPIANSGLSAFVVLPKK